MAVPKRRTSKSRRDMRRSHHKAKLQSLSLCSHCGQPKKPHYICPSCGYYNGKEIVTVSGD
ncbi:MAG: 50S ribosomal protein L32 [Candidatus Aureabacteria bacterium]|nr:50S ribosomal protein L32 [Candidatus Auribacterota bacterium]